MKRIPKRKQCYTCGKDIRFISADNEKGFILCDYETKILKRNPDGDIFFDPNGKSFTAVPAGPADNTVSIGYKLHRCRA